MRTRGLLALGICVAAACGRIAESPDGSVDASSIPDADAASPVDAAVEGSSVFDAGVWNNCSADAGARWNLGYACTQDSDCCSNHCFLGSCQRPACVSDNAACTSAAECCSGACASGTCAPLNAACKTLGNACTQSSECCSATCKGNVCVQPSFCGQNADTCESDADCCLAACERSPNAMFGLCNGINQSCQADGVVCATTWDGGPPACGGACCSRLCAPWGPLQVPICHPASGCHPAGDTCFKSSACCGAAGSNPIVACYAYVDGGMGVCGNATSCKPNGDICRLATTQCNATDNCCSGYVPTYDTCRQDNLGVLRCSYPGDGGSCASANGACASSADCCNGAPCVPVDGGFACYPASCVPASGTCTRDADCCVGTQCYLSGAQIAGTCRARVDGASCALYGQSCTAPSDCCNGVPCTSGRCEY